MGVACRKCGGVGYGFIDPEVGHRGTDPCDVCAPPEGAERGPLVMATGTQARGAARPDRGGIEYVGGGGPGVGSGQAFDVGGLVNTGKEVVTIDQALAATSEE